MFLSKISRVLTINTDWAQVRRYAAPPSSRRSLDVAMAAVVRGLQGSDLLLRPDIVQSAATRLAHEAHGLASP